MILEIIKLLEIKTEVLQFHHKIGYNVYGGVKEKMIYKYLKVVYNNTLKIELIN